MEKKRLLELAGVPMDSPTVKKLVALAEADKRIRYSAYSYGSDQTLFSGRAVSAEEAAKKVAAKLKSDYKYSDQDVKYTILKKGDTGAPSVLNPNELFIKFPKAKVSVSFDPTRTVGSNQYDDKITEDIDLSTVDPTDVHTSELAQFVAEHIWHTFQSDAGFDEMVENIRSKLAELRKRSQ